MEIGAGCCRRLRPALMARHLAIATLYMYDQYISDQQPLNAATVTIAAEEVRHHNSAMASSTNHVESSVENKK